MNSTTSGENRAASPQSSKLHVERQVLRHPAYDSDVMYDGVVNRAELIRFSAADVLSDYVGSLRPSGRSLLVSRTAGLQTSPGGRGEARQPFPRATIIGGVETREERIAALVAALDGTDHNEAEGARFALQHDHDGADVVDALLEAAPTFGDFGQVLAAEVFESVGDERALGILQTWLTSGDPTLRLVVVGALGSIGSPVAIPALLDAWAASKLRGEPPSWTEPTSIRSVLARLGGREIVVPDDVRVLAIHSERFGLAWAPGSLGQVLTSLASARQVIVALAFWKHDRDTSMWRWLAGITILGDQQWSIPWPRLVAVSLERARREVKAMKVVRRATDVEVTIDWIDERDL